MSERQIAALILATCFCGAISGARAVLFYLGLLAAMFLISGHIPFDWIPA